MVSDSCRPKEQKQQKPTEEVASEGVHKLKQKRAEGAGDRHCNLSGNLQEDCLREIKLNDDFEEDLDDKTRKVG